MKNAPIADSNESALNKRDYTCRALSHSANAVVTSVLYWLRRAAAVPVDAMTLAASLALAE